MRPHIGWVVDIVFGVIVAAVSDVFDKFNMSRGYHIVAFFDASKHNDDYFLCFTALFMLLILRFFLRGVQASLYPPRQLEPMESYPFADFVLPVQPSALDTLIVATAFTYSRVWNRRRLESLSYGFWNHLLICLISTLAPNLFLIPQLTIYNAPEPREFPNLSINTVAEKDADERQPDFTIMGTQFRRRDDRQIGSNGFIVPSDFQQWNEITKK